MTLKELFRRGWTRCRIAEVLGVSEGAVRYHLKRQAEEAKDGRSQQRQLAEDWSGAIQAWMEGLGEGPLNLARLHEWLVEEHGYPGSLRSLQRYVGRHFPPPPKAGQVARGDASRGPGPGRLGDVHGSARRRAATGSLKRFTCS